MDNKPKLDPVEAAGIFSESVTRNLYNPTDRIFLEWECFQDFNIGTLLCMIRDDPARETKYEYIMARLDDYRKGWDLGCAEYFPVLGVSDEDIIAFQKNPENAVLLNAMSPTTVFFYGFPDIAENCRIARDARQEDENTQYVYLSTKYVTIPEVTKNKWRIWCRDLFGPQAQLEFREGGVPGMGAGFMSQMDLMVLTDWSQIVQDHHNCQAIFEEMAWIDKTVYAYLKADDDIENVDFSNAKRVNEAFTQTQKFYNTFCNFTFIPRKIAGADYGEKQKS